MWHGGRPTYTDQHILASPPLGHMIKVIFHVI